jgi:PAS domain-containing protein
MVAYRAEFGAVARWLYIGPEIEELLGYTPAEWTSTDGIWIKRLHPDDRAGALADEEHTHATGEPLRSEYRMHAKDGRMVQIRDEGVVVEENGKRLIEGSLRRIGVPD